MRRRAFLAAGGGAVVAGVLAWRLWPEGSAAVGPVTRDDIGDQVQTLPKGKLPQFAETADVQRLYRFAVEHGEELQYIPCFCGCYRFGHTSNRECYVKALNANGTVTFTSHAAT